VPDVIMPRLSDSMEEGTILTWLVSDGGEVTCGQEIAEIETDKATMTYEADADGVLQIVAAEGDTLPIGALIARIGKAHTAEAAALAKRPAIVGTAGPLPGTVSAPSVTGAAPRAGTLGSTGRLKASPIARRIARDRGVDLDKLTGTGPSGRIVKADVLAAAEAAASTHNGHAAQPIAAGPAAAAPDCSSTAAASPPVPVTEPTGGAKCAVTAQELSRVQQLIARRMAEAKATIPEFSLSIDIDMEACAGLREQLRGLVTGERPPPSFNDFVVKACAIALREHPRANGCYRDGAFQLHERVNVGVAVAAQDTLVVPTVFDADQKSLGAIAAQTRGLAERVRAGTITPPELAGGTFSISNLGMFGIHRFTAVINPPQAAILAVGAIVARPVVRDAALVARRTMTVTLSADHRVLYGADAAAFLGRVRDLLEQPLRVLSA
jgi:pyruvate dehydrogenase E2 component (dihydrolipoamide acetyltransferase)